MAIAPSPTAAATRLAEPLCTSPTAKMPGRLVSSAELFRLHPAAPAQRGERRDPGLVQPGVGPVQIRGLHQLPGLRCTVRRHNISASSRPVRTTGRWGGRPRGRAGAEKSRSSRRARRSGTAASAPIPSRAGGIPRIRSVSAGTPAGSWSGGGRSPSTLACSPFRFRCASPHARWGTRGRTSSDQLVHCGWHRASRTGDVGPAGVRQAGAFAMPRFTHRQVIPIGATARVVVAQRAPETLTHLVAAVARLRPPRRLLSR